MLHAGDMMSDRSPAAKVDKVRRALLLLDDGELGQSADLLGTMVSRKRFVRASNSNAVPEEVAEVKLWLERVVADPEAEDADEMIARAYYKLRSQMPSTREGSR
jgi:hypothetical protein